MGGFCLTYETPWYLQWFTRYRWKQFLTRFLQIWILSPISFCTEIWFPKCSQISIQGYSFWIRINQKNKNEWYWICIVEIILNSNTLEWDVGDKSQFCWNLIKKLFPSVSWEPLKVPWCFLCQTKSPNVEIKWLKGYCVLSTFAENIFNQSCSSNRGTPWNLSAVSVI